ncbi:putative neprosin [Helianthus annuus]|nr:putative neprosin [Helianthus annuus]
MAEVKLSFGFAVVLYVFMAARLCYTDNNRSSSSHENVEVQKLLNSLNKPAVKSIKSSDGDIIDCVRISDQPAFDHPLLKNHTIKMRPIYHPNPVDDTKVSSMMNSTTDGRSSSSITQLWHSTGKCPKGTIPVRRTKKVDVLRASSIKSFGKKRSSFGAKSSLFDVELDASEHHEYAVASTKNGQFYGSKSALNLWNPKVQESNEFSLAQTWVVGGTYETGLNTIEAGWQVYPLIYGDTNTRLFIYWTSDGYQKTGCYNLCSGFIQTNNKYAIGGSLSPTSETDGTQQELTILIWKDNAGGGDWWMQLNGETIGYWPSSLFTHLRNSASIIQWGGEIINRRSQGRHTTTQMGSGQFPKLWYRKASYIRKIETIDQSNALRTAEVSTSHEQNCYDILTRITTDNFWGTHFFYGGPGRNPNCP